MMNLNGYVCYVELEAVRRLTEIYLKNHGISNHYNFNFVSKEIKYVQKQPPEVFCRKRCS